MLTLERAKELTEGMITEDHLIIHCTNVMAAMGAMARHFGADEEHWKAVGYLHDYDYEKFPEEHLQHTEQELYAEGVSEEDVRAILSHGYGICTDVKPETEMETSLFTVDELTGIIEAAARMRPHGITDLNVKSFMKKFKDKRFAAKCNRPPDPSGLRDAGHGHPRRRGNLHRRHAPLCGRDRTSRDGGLKPWPKRHGEPETCCIRCRPCS